MSGVKDYGYDEENPGNGFETFEVNDMDDLLAYFEQEKGNDVKELDQTED